MLQEISVIYRVYNCFLNSIVWIVPKTFCLLPTGNLTHMLFEYIALDVIHCLFYHLRNTAFECNFCEIVWIIHFSVRECHYINLSVREELAWILAEHHGYHIAKQTVFFWSCVQFHLVKYGRKRSRYHIISQFATHFDKIITKKHQRNIFQQDVAIASFIKRHTISQLSQFNENFTSCLNATCATANVEIFFCPFRCYVYRHRIWTVTASRTPYNYQLFAINLLYRSARQVVWSHFVVVAHHLLQNVIYLFHWHAFYRSYCHASLIIGIYTYNDISTAKVIKVIGESTYTVIYASWVPAFLELNAVGFNSLLVKQVVYVYCECHFIILKITLLFLGNTDYFNLLEILNL